MSDDACIDGDAKVALAAVVLLTHNGLPDGLHLSWRYLTPVLDIALHIKKITFV